MLCACSVCLLLCRMLSFFSVGSLVGCLFRWLACWLFGCLVALVVGQLCVCVFVGFAFSFVGAFVCFLCVFVCLGIWCDGCLFSRFGCCCFCACCLQCVRAFVYVFLFVRCCLYVGLLVCVLFCLIARLSV